MLKNLSNVLDESPDSFLEAVYSPLEQCVEMSSEQCILAELLYLHAFYGIKDKGNVQKLLTCAKNNESKTIDNKAVD